MQEDKKIIDVKENDSFDEESKALLQLLKQKLSHIDSKSNSICVNDFLKDKEMLWSEMLFENVYVHYYTVLWWDGKKHINIAFDIQNANRVMDLVVQDKPRWEWLVFYLKYLDKNWLQNSLFISQSDLKKLDSIPSSTALQNIVNVLAFPQ